MLSTSAVNSLDPIYGALAQIFLATFCIILTISIFTLYIKKLVQVYKHANDAGDTLIRIATKTTILTVTSLSSQIICLSAYVCLGLGIMNVYWIWVLFLSTEIDICINYYCIILGYKYFEKTYGIFCGCIDRKCVGMVIDHNANVGHIKSNLELTSPTILTSSSNIESSSPPITTDKSITDMDIDEIP